LKNTLFFYNGEFFQPLGVGEALYRGDNSPAAWSVSAVSAVPEPSPCLMLLGGLALAGFAARRQRAGSVHAG
jgi:hypothetical protein